MGLEVLLAPEATYILVRDNLNALDMTGGLEDLAQDLLGDARVQATNIQRTLVGLGSGTTTERAAAAGRDDAALIAAGAHRRGDGGRDGVSVLRDVKRRGRHMSRVRASVLAVLVARGARVGLRGRDLTRGRRRTVVSHGWNDGAMKTLERRVEDGDEWKS